MKKTIGSTNYRWFFTNEARRISKALDYIDKQNKEETQNDNITIDDTYTRSIDYSGYST